jgi:Domain of unknown function (DUF4911)
MFQPLIRYFLLDRRDLVYLTFILEAYEGLTTLSTVDKQQTLVSITTFPCSAEALDDLLTAVGKEITLTETAPPQAADAAGGEHRNA